MTDATTAAPAAPATSAAAALTPAPAAPAPAEATSTALATTPAAAPAEAAAAPAAPALALPGKDATPDQWSAFYDQIGRPKTPDEYGITAREGEDQAMVAEVAATMHKHGLTKAQAAGLMELQQKAVERLQQQEAERIAALDKKNAAEQTALKTELGERYEPQMELARRAARQFAGEQTGDIIGALEDKIGYKATIELFMRIGAGLGEHDANASGSGQGQGERKPTQAVLYGS